MRSDRNAIGPARNRPLPHTSDKCEVLFIDDDEYFSGRYLAVLRESGFTVHYCREAGKAEHTFLAHSDIAIVVLDVMMPPPPGMPPVLTGDGFYTGFWVLDRIKKHLLARRCPLLVLTNLEAGRVCKAMVDFDLPAGTWDVCVKHVDALPHQLPHVLRSFIVRAEHACKRSAVDPSSGGGAMSDVIRNTTQIEASRQTKVEGTVLEDRSVNSWSFDENAAKIQLANALVGLGLLSLNEPAPLPYAQSSGVAGRSRVWFLFLPRGDSGMSLVAKFDEPTRAAREWNAIEELRCLNSPPAAMLPVAGSKREHGVIIYQDVSALTLTGKVGTLKDLLISQLAFNYQNCAEAARQAFQPLALFYGGEPGGLRLAENGKTLRWEDVFPSIKAQMAGIQAGAKQAWDSLDWVSSREIEVPCGPLTPIRKLPNPLIGVEQRLSELTGRIMLSRIHGDLNLTNVLFGLSGKQAPGCVFIIDLANSDRGKPTAVDLARLESEFWHEVFTEWKAGSDGVDEPTCLSALVAARDFLDGRVAVLPTSTQRFAVHAAKWVNMLRQEAVRTLRGSQDEYCLFDYMMALYCSHVRALGFASVRASSLKCRVAVLCAALAVEFLEDLARGRYGPGASDQLCLPWRPEDEFAQLRNPQ